jgi:hypothetical protein
MEYNYTQHLLAYLDVMGFQEILEKKPERALLVVEEINNLKRLLEDGEQLGFSLDVKAKGLSSRRNVSSFSDLIVISYEYSPENLEELFETFQQLVLEVAYIILRLAEKDIYIRGAVTQGELYHQDGVITGSGLVDAYKLEGVAGYPRVIVSHDCYRKLLHAGINTSMNLFRFGRINELLETDFDQLWSVNFLEFFKNELDEIEFQTRLNKIAELVKYRLETELKDNVRAKYGYFEKKLKAYITPALSKPVDVSNTLQR